MKNRDKEESKAGQVEGEESEQLDPEDTYESWRTDPEIWKPGETSLFIRVREVDSNFYVPLNPNYLGEMPPYEDFTAQFPEGGMIEVTIKGSRSIKGKRRTIKGPLRIAIAPKGEKTLSGFGNPYGFSSRGNSTGADKEWLKMYHQMYQQQLTDSKTQGNQWLNLMTSPAFQKKDDYGPMMFQMMNMQQSLQQHAQQMQYQLAAQQAQANKQLILGLVTALAPLAIGLLEKRGGDKDQIFSLITQSMQQASQAATEQNKILLGAVMNKDDFGKQLELFEKFKALTDDSPIGEIAKLVESAGLGTAINSLAEAGATRIASSKAGPPAIEPPAQPAGQTAPPNPYQQTSSPTVIPPQTINATQAQASNGFNLLLKVLSDAFQEGEDPKEVAKTFWEGSKQYREHILAFNPAEIAEKIKIAGPALGLNNLSGKDAQDFIIDFTGEVKRLASEATP